jgi:hypothetical protein
VGWGATRRHQRTSATDAGAMHRRPNRSIDAPDPCGWAHVGRPDVHSR